MCILNFNTKSIEERLKDLFKHLHEHPEISWEEHETRNYIQSVVSPYDCKVQTFDDCAAVVVEIGSGKPVVAIRADMDALWQEVDGTMQANHSCGHDAHMTIVLGVFLTLMEKGLTERGTHRFIFQPAEEKGTGALKMVEHGVVDDVDFLYGMHLRPTEELEAGQFAPAIRHGAAKFIEGTVLGEDAHGARPHLNENAIQIGMELFQHLNNIHADPRVPYSVKMTAFQAGGKNANIIPGKATFSIDVRAQTNEVMTLLTDKIEKIARMLEEYHCVPVKLKTKAHVAAAVPNKRATEILQEAITEQVGRENTKSAITTTGGDDFHFYTIQRPELRATMLAIGCGLKPGLHHPQMTFNHEAIPEAVSILTKAMVKTAEKYSQEGIRCQ
ncbi:M20 peptidase aminoacylase family protein [Virgibacillus halodenitrificans]|uniref:M20 peptidase aminoacylase family protein n=1 Tax=Virgibacillus halodenitrificans TaxID=1482 RepID=A0ABR7VKI8_VIRHA|nr:M20 peptidase aminoacylase family protein [Virgibacillus halodenitrificans]MBD1221283.1 M20 peptidase aminoacylase family protein [Virgibacillus halodenitrificans]